MQLEPLGNLLNAVQRCVMTYKVDMVKLQSSPGTALINLTHSRAHVLEAYSHSGVATIARQCT
jgi:hypothetical protein